MLLEKPLEISHRRAPKSWSRPAGRAGVNSASCCSTASGRSAWRCASDREGRLGQHGQRLGAAPNWRPQSYYDQPGRGTKARDGGGVLMTQAIHTLDLLISLAGAAGGGLAYADDQPGAPHGDGGSGRGGVRFENGAHRHDPGHDLRLSRLSRAIEMIGDEGHRRARRHELIVAFHDGREFEIGDDERRRRRRAPIRWRSRMITTAR